MDRLEQFLHATYGVPRYERLCRYRVKDEVSRFVVVDTHGETHWLQGEKPGAVRHQLQTLFADFKTFTPRPFHLHRSDAGETETFAWACASLYVGLLTIRPFVVGNDDVAYAALHAALHRLGLQPLELRVRSMPLNDALADALSPDRMMEPLVDVLRANVFDLRNA